MDPNTLPVMQHDSSKCSVYVGQFFFISCSLLTSNWIQKCKWLPHMLKKCDWRIKVPIKMYVYKCLFRLSSCSWMTGSNRVHWHLKERLTNYVTLRPSRTGSETCTQLCSEQHRTHSSAPHQAGMQVCVFVHVTTQECSSVTLACAHLAVCMCVRVSVI